MSTLGFDELGLPDHVLQTVTSLGYETPSPIQEQTIPPLLEGGDVIGLAQTGTGKTAAFALPILSRLDLKISKPQALILAPTRELALQVSEAFQKYGAGLPGLRVLAVYGGAAYGPQLSALRRGAHVVVGTPGRVMDHIEKGTLALGDLRTIVLDEADEMLRMGFLDDVEWILSRAPEERQIALFSATLPAQIRRIADGYLSEPTRVTLKTEKKEAAAIRQRVWIGGGWRKLDALTRILEVEDHDGVIVFARTKHATVELADQLAARGFSTAALNGDVAQTDRERIVEKLKSGGINILVATDVAARGLDVERISHVFNYDAPHDAEGYVHRIGRTGRAGRSGDAILFLIPRDQRMLRHLERASAGRIEIMQLPTDEQVDAKRVDAFEAKLAKAAESKRTKKHREILEGICQRQGFDPIEAAAALMTLHVGERPFLMEDEPKRVDDRPKRREFTNDRYNNDRGNGRRDFGGQRGPRNDAPRNDGPRPPAGNFQSYRIEVGHTHGVRTGNIVGAIAGESELDGRSIGRIEIRHDHSMVELPPNLPEATLKKIGRTQVAGQALRIRPNQRRAA